ncbi:hypothetical protein FAGAP_704 [Fusarium agapanthi]|uniref:Uncharacterized protein n=1 Tax=Fusarium agapanthi TaxID=1803897 RepID=A0A9P5EBS8_9HYPO|nr:hypothetical protein FAGAP_704 [Fusarium agapanthi]
MISLTSSQEYKSESNALPGKKSRLILWTENVRCDESRTSTDRQLSSSTSASLVTPSKNVVKPNDCYRRSRPDRAVPCKLWWHFYTILEDEHMSTNYKYGDGKTLDAANFGVFKVNWGMLRVCAKRAGFVGHSDIYADVASRWDCQEQYGYDKRFAGHRNVATGLLNPNTEDIRFYRESVEWIQAQIDSKSTYKTDDTRFWVDVTPIQVRGISLLPGVAIVRLGVIEGLIDCKPIQQVDYRACAT